LSLLEPVAVVVVLYNSALLLPAFLDALPNGLEGLRWTLTAVDNASDDGSADTVRKLTPTATVVEMGHNAGYAAGINAGVAAAGHYGSVLVLNADVRLFPGCVPTLIEALGRRGGGIAVPRLWDAHGRRIDSMRREPTVLRALGDAVLGATRAGRFPALGEVIADPDLYLSERFTDWAEGSTQLISAACWNACGSWDESFFLYSEETDYNLRARDLGYPTLYVPNAEATHLEGGSGTSPALWSLLILNRVRLFRRRNGLAASLTFWLLTALREASRAVLGRQTSRAAIRAFVRTRPFESARPI
jgi:GT2 family glycosyltransferase